MSVSPCWCHRAPEGGDDDASHRCHSEEDEIAYFLPYIQALAERWSPGCVNAECKARQKWKATAITKFTKPGDRLYAEPCIKDAHFDIPEYDAAILLLVGAADGGGGEERRHHLLQRPGAPGEAGVLERAVEK